jgi:hypothetical protein
MLQPYALPHECESAEIADLLGQLSPKQRRALRSYVWQVELGEQTLTAWLASDTCPVARSSWYESGPRARYWCNDGFKMALRAYLAAGLRWRTTQDRRDVERARRTLLLETPHAAERLVEGSRGDIGQLIKVVERWTHDPLPSQEIIQEEEREDQQGIKHRVFLVRQAVLDLTRLGDPRYSRMVKKFSDSPARGIAIEMYDALHAAESILDRADLETASKAPVGPGGGVVVVIPDNGRADRADPGRADNGRAATRATDTVPGQSG